MKTTMKKALTFTLPILAVLMMFGGPVYGVNKTTLEGHTKMSSGAGLVLLKALQSPY